MTLPWVALKELVEPKTGTMNPTAWPEDPFTYVDIAGVDNKLKIIAGARTMKGAEAPSRARKLMRTGDVLVATVRPNLNAVAMVPESLDGEIASTAFCVLRATPRVLPEYVFFFVRSALFLRSMHKLARGALYPAVTESMILAQKLPLPDMAEQRRIVDMLLCAQSAMRNRRGIREKTAQMNPALFVDVFGDTVANPKGWPVVPLGTLLKNGPQNGLYKPQTAYGSGTPIVRIDAFYDGVLCDLPLLKRLQLEEHEVKRYALAEGDIIINRVNSPEYLGKSALIPALSEPTVFESNMMRFTLDPEKALPRFIIETLQATRTQRHFRISAKRAISQASLNQQDVKNLPVMLPPLAEQAKFARYADAAAAAMVTQARMLKVAEAIFATLLARTFAPGV